MHQIFAVAKAVYGKLEWSKNPLQECAYLRKQNTKHISNVDITQTLSMTFETLS